MRKAIKMVTIPGKMAVALVVLNAVLLVVRRGVVKSEVVRRVFAVTLMKLQQQQMELRRLKSAWSDWVKNVRK